MRFEPQACDAAEFVRNRAKSDDPSWWAQPILDQLEQLNYLKKLIVQIDNELEQTNRVIPLELTTYAQINNSARQIRLNGVVDGTIHLKDSDEL